ncbi:MAG: photosynthetic reaction center subunit H [Sandaracinobacteroides sp.]
MSPVIVGNIDVALLSFYAFVLFFIGLVIYLNRESRREGYPLEDEMTGQLMSTNLLDDEAPKVFRLPHGGGIVNPKTARDSRDIKAAKSWGRHGSPYVPTGDPLVDGVGPAAFAQRARHPDLDWEGHARIVPMRVAAGISISRGDADPRGFAMLGVDGKDVGKVSELWIDRADRLVRYLEVVLTSGRTVLVPMAMVVVKGKMRAVQTDSISAAQFANVPGIASPDTVTLDEEERIVAYFGGGYLYSSPERAEPIL